MINSPPYSRTRKGDFLIDEGEIQRDLTGLKRLVEVASIQKPGVKPFVGVRPYVATADVEGWTIINSTKVDFASRPTRANVEPKIGDVLLAKMKDTFKVVLVDHDSEKMIFSTGFVDFRPTRDVLPQFLFYMLMTPNIQSLKNHFSTGETQKAINNESIAKYLEIPVPSKHVQKAAVERCDSIRRNVEEMRTQQKDIEKLASFLRNRLFEGMSNFSSLENVIKLIYRYPTFYGFKYTERGVPVVKISNMRADGRLDTDLSHYDRIPSEVSKRYPKTILRPRDIVMGVRGTYIGLSALVPETLEEANTSPNMIRIEPNRDRILPEFLWNYLQTDACREEIERLVNYWKVGFGTIKSGELKDIAVPLPPMQVQQKTVRILGKVLSIKSSIELCLNDTTELMLSYLGQTYSKLVS